MGFDTSGCWVRIIDPKKEIKYLARREDYDGKQLLGHDDQKRIDYTHYSPCTYVKEGFAISLFGGLRDNFGIFIRPFNRRIDWWYNGRREIVTDNIKPKPGIKYDNGAKDSDQRWNCTIEEIEEAVTALRDEYAADYYYQENPDEIVTMAWNEGFLRHQRKDITGLLVNKESKSSVYFALAFRSALELPVHLYSYDHSGNCEYLNSYELCKKLGINTQTDYFKKIVTDCRKFYQDQLVAVRIAKTSLQEKQATFALK